MHGSNGQPSVLGSCGNMVDGALRQEQGKQTRGRGQGGPLLWNGAMPALGKSRSRASKKGEHINDLHHGLVADPSQDSACSKGAAQQHADGLGSTLIGAGGGSGSPSRSDTSGPLWQCNGCGYKRNSCEYQRCAACNLDWRRGEQLFSPSGVPITPRGGGGIFGGYVTGAHGLLEVDWSRLDESKGAGKMDVRGGGGRGPPKRARQPATSSEESSSSSRTRNRRKRGGRKDAMEKMTSDQAVEVQRRQHIMRLWKAWRAAASALGRQDPIAVALETTYKEAWQKQVAQAPLLRQLMETTKKQKRCKHSWTPSPETRRYSTMS